MVTIFVRTFRSLCLAALAINFLVPATHLSAATKIWTGAVSTAWTAAGNWSGAGAPAAGDDLSFPADGARQSNSNDYPAGTPFNSISVTGGSYFLGGNEISLGAGGINVNGGSGTRLSLPITLSAPQTWTLTPTGSSVVEIQKTTTLNGMALTLNRAIVDFESSIMGTGSISVTGASNVSLTSAGNTTNAPLTVSDTGSLSIGDLFDFGVTYPGSITMNSSNPRFITLYTGSGASFGSLVVNAGYFRNGFGTAPTGVTNSGNFTLGPAATLGTALTNPAPNVSQLNVTGTVALAGRLDVTASSILAAGTAFRIINNDGIDPVIGTFAGLPEGAHFTSRAPTGSTTAPLQNFVITYAGGTGNDVVVTALGARNRRER